MLQYTPVVLKKPQLLTHCLFINAYLSKTLKKSPKQIALTSRKHGINPICLGGGAQCAHTAVIA